MLGRLFRMVDSEYLLVEGTGKELPEIVVAPPYLIVEDAAMLAQSCEVKVAAQNCSSEKDGAFTGEISASMLKAVKADYVILGHSERRALFGEANQVISRKIDRAMESDLYVICCVGESLQDREAAKEFQVITHQLEECLFHLSNEQMRKVVIAYEPVWAIGTGRNATPRQAQEMHNYIRSVISGKFGKETSENISILYGGSCNPKNAKEIFSQPDVDGGLIGGASLNEKDFMDVIRAAL